MTISEKLGVLATALAATASNIARNADAPAGSTRISDRVLARRLYLAKRRERKGLKKVYAKHTRGY